MTSMNYAFPKKEVKSANGSALTMNEQEILKYILEMKYLSLDQIIRRFYDEGKVEEAVRKLLNIEYLKCKDQELKESSLFVVSQLGYEYVLKNNPEKKIPAPIRSVFKPRVNHDLLLNDLRIRFEQLNFLNKWVSEQTQREIPLFLRTFRDLPDAVCKKRNDKSYFLELEVSMKGPKQYRERIEEYLKVLQMEEIKEAGVEGVIFFCVNDEVVEKIKGQIPEGAKGISVLSYYRYFESPDKASSSAQMTFPKVELGALHA